MQTLSRVTGLMAAAAMALAGVMAPKPAKASNDELIQFLLGAAAVAVIVQSFSSPPREEAHRRYTGRVLPAHCRETLRVRHRHIEVYNARCLRQAGMRRLPDHCAETVRTNRGQRHVHRERCLRAAGYQVEHKSSPLERLRPTGVLPRHCEITYRHRGNQMRGYDGACLQNYGLSDLPDGCALHARRNGGRMTIYNRRCLLDAGYRTAQRRW